MKGSSLLARVLFSFFFKTVSDVFKALPGRTSLSWLSHTLPQFGNLEVTCHVSSNLTDAKEI